DGDLTRYNFIPALVVNAMKPGETVDQVVARTTAELHELGDRYRDQWRIRRSIEGDDVVCNDGYDDDGDYDDDDDADDDASPKGKGKGHAKAKGKGKGKGKAVDSTATPKTPKTSKPPKKGGKGSDSFGGPSGSTAGPPESASGSSSSTVTAGRSGDQTWDSSGPTICITGPEIRKRPTTSTKKPTNFASQKAKGKGKAKAVVAEEDQFEYELPTLYGLIIAHTIVAIVSYDVAVHHKDPLRSIAVFDFGDNDQDVWNAFAVAIVVVTVRNYLMDLDWEEKAVEVEVDPDL
ncbi:MAG: hypothetical protein Q9187_009227, partial [Circinaria calcarea]